MGVAGHHRHRRYLPLIIIIITTTVLVVTLAEAEKEGVFNKSGLYWSTGDEADESAAAAAVLNERDELDGGFPSLDGMLHWAIGHSDPAKLQSKAQDIKELSTEELKRRQMEIKELMENLEMPSDAQLMKNAIADLNNSSLRLEEHHRAFEELLILVEAVDNANDLHKLGGLAVVIRELGNSDPTIRTTAAWVLGKSSQNNPFIQKQVLELGALLKLMMMVKSSFTEEAIKAFFAVSAVIRNNLDAQKSFYTEGGDLMLQGILSNSSADIRLHRKSVSLVADLAESQLESRSGEELPFFSSCFFLGPVVDMTETVDLDLKEKSLSAIKNLLLLPSTKTLVFTSFCGLDGALDRMKQQLKLIVEENQREYATDIEILHKEVSLIFLEKLNKVKKQVPTSMMVHHES